MASKLLRIINKIDANSRAIAKVVSAKEYLVDCGGDESAAISILRKARFALLQQRRNLRLELEHELKEQPGWNNGRKRAASVPSVAEVRKVNGRDCYRCGALVADNRCKSCYAIQDESKAVPA